MKRGDRGRGETEGEWNQRQKGDRESEETEGRKEKKERAKARISRTNVGRRER